MRNKLVETAAPGQELMGSACRLTGIDFDTHLAQLIDDITTLDEVFFTPVHIHIVDLLVELVGVGKNTIVSRFHVKTEDGATESAEPSELVKVLEHYVKRLVTTP